ncbi:uncharacterized protein NECHADRAFT_100957 [Fusarium vanettenii 77-13-4]|uniref:Uncharacterized protein n=1 Tax=Fusarium vanettenii (strain ATCC MYA-4622 / CBS 123669 / FGSC 9596 / NRRL 45880 / 77-13-4) TaxID=660122 RepID=C7Z9P3_FUSV7|nr:uncharacterized protein NECHADRAFT_100957 [Fusarium vanettenii 77-13-4]EEU39537.1 predicted protein [Fusarium vanettenii 77-13-4]
MSILICVGCVLLMAGLLIWLVPNHAQSRLKGSWSHLRNQRRRTKTHGSSNIEDMNPARVSEDDDSPAEQEPVRDGDGADTSSSSSDNEDKAPPEGQSQGKGSSSDKEQGHEASNTEDQEQEPSNERNMDAEQGSLPVVNMTEGIPPTEEIQPIPEIQPVQEIQPVKEVNTISTVDQPKKALADDETPEDEGSFSWKLWRCWEGALDCCCATCLVDPECVAGSDLSIGFVVNSK